MDLLNMIGAARRHWVLMVIGTSLGVIIAIFSAFKLVSTPDGARVTSRTTPVYESRSRLLIAEPNLDVARMNPQQSWPTGYTKTIEMAPTYALLAVGDDVRRKAEEAVGTLKARVSAAAIEKTPIIVLKATGPDPQGTVTALKAMTGSFVEYLAEQQDDKQVPNDQRVRLVVLSSPSAPSQVSSGAMQVGMLAFLAPVLASLALAVSLDSDKRKRAAVHNGAQVG